MRTLAMPAWHSERLVDSVAMWLRFGSSGQALQLDLGDWIGARPLVRARVSATTAQGVVAAAIVPMVAVTVWLALTS